MINKLPKDIQLILNTREDLLILDFDKTENEKKLCNWLISCGFNEYPYLKSSDANNEEFHLWLGKKNKNDLYPRIINSLIFLLNKKFKKRWFFPKNVLLKIYIIKIFWRFLPYNLPNYHNVFPTKSNKHIFFFKNFLNLNEKNSEKLSYKGINLIGYANHNLGIAEDLRTTKFALDLRKISSNLINFEPGDIKERKNNFASKSKKKFLNYKFTLICLSAEETCRFRVSQGKNYFKNRYVIAYWPWELPNWPERLNMAFDLVDEIWVSTKFIKDSIIPKTKKPIKIMPLVVDYPDNILKPISENERNNLRQSLNIKKENIISIFCFDINSSMFRKNPMKTVETFVNSFDKNSNYYEKLNLIIKTYPSYSKINHQWEDLKKFCLSDKRIKIIESNMTRKELLKLIGSCDIFLSLHRSEGFGRLLAESFKLGLDVIATNWSGNVDFCDGPLYSPVNFSLRELRPEEYKYYNNQYWAEPDLEDAINNFKSVIFKRLKEGRPNASIIEKYNKRFSAEECGQRYLKRLKELGLISNI